MEKIMAVCDEDPIYSQRLSDVVNQKEKAPFTMVPFSSINALKDYGVKHSIEILIIGESLYRDSVNDIGARSVITLSEGDPVNASRNIPSVYKYQAADDLIREVMSAYCEAPSDSQLLVLKKQAQIFGIYSPVGRCCKTSLALTCGQLLARDRNVLYLGFDEFSGFSCLLEEDCKSDLSDVLYFFRQNELDMARLKSLVYTWKDLDYIPPVRYPDDLEQITGEETAALLEKLATEMGYEALIVDVGRPGKSLIPILRCCSLIYMPALDDGGSLAKLDDFEEYLRLAGEDIIIDKIRKLKIPRQERLSRSGACLDQLLWGELGDYVRTLLRGKL